MEDRTNGYIYEIASPLELGVADHREQAHIVWQHGDQANTARLVRILTAVDLSEALWKAGMLIQMEPEDAQP